MAPTLRKKKCKQSCSTAQDSSLSQEVTGVKRLPSDCLFLIFSRIPLQTLIPLRLVCPSWNSMVVYICAHKDRLILAPYSPPEPLGKSAFDLYWIDDLTRYLVDRTENVYESVHFSTDQLTKQSTVGLAQLFPGVTELRLRYDCGQLGPTYLAKIEALFRHFSLSPNLKVFSFTLSSNVSNLYPKIGHISDALCKMMSNITLSRLPHLKQLDLCIAGDFFSFLSLYSTFAIDYQTKQFDDTLVQLKRFSLGYNSPHWDTKSTLAKLGPSLVSLCLNLNDKFYKNFDTLISIFDNVKFQSSLTHLRLGILCAASNHAFIRALCDRFLALKFVQLQIVGWYGHNINFPAEFDDQWMEPLCTLQHLSQLRFHDFNVSLDCGLSMSRVKKLTLCKRNLIAPRSLLFDAFCRTLATQFPNLEQLVLVCRPFLGCVNENTRAQQMEQQMRQHLNDNFAHLRSVVLDFTAPEWK